MSVHPYWGLYLSWGGAKLFARDVVHGYFLNFYVAHGRVAVAEGLVAVLAHDDVQGLAFFVHVVHKVHPAKGDYTLRFHAVAAGHFGMLKGQGVVGTEGDTNVGLLFQGPYHAPFGSAVQIDYAFFITKIHGQHVGLVFGGDDPYKTDVAFANDGFNGGLVGMTYGSPGNSPNRINISELYIEDGDFVKIQDVSLGYDFVKLFPNLPFSQARFYVAGRNLFTFTDYSGMDSEVGYGDDQPFVSGIDLGFYPAPKTYLMGINLKF